MKMSQKKFTFNDEDEDTNDIYQSHIDKYDSYYQQSKCISKRDIK